MMLPQTDEREFAPKRMLNLSLVERRQFIGKNERYLLENHDRKSPAIPGTTSSR